MTMTGATIILIFICISSLKISSTQKLKDTIVNTDSFFNNLIKKYEMTELTDNVKIIIDKEIDQYLKVVLEQLQTSRYKKELHKSNTQETGVGVFDGIEKILNLNVSDVRDMHFFKKYNGYEQWFVATLASSNITVYRLLENTLIQVCFYQVMNASKIQIVKFHGSILLLVQKSQHIIVLYLFPQGGKFEIRETQRFDVNNIEDLSVWRRENELFLGVSSTSEIHVYSWLNDRFEPIQILPFGAKFSAPFQLGEDSRYLVTSRHQLRTAILEYLPRTRQFVTAQSIRRSFDDVAILHLRARDRSASECFLALSSVEEGTILYKRSDELGMFAPFQEIGPADRVLSLARDSTALLMLLKDGVAKVYQYDGWRFVLLKFQIVGVEKLEWVAFNGEEQLLVKRIDGGWSLNRINWTKINEPINPNKEIKQWCLAAKEKAKQIPKSIPETRTPIRISNANVQKVKVKRVNEMSIEKLQNLTERYNRLISRLAVVNESLSKITSAKNSHFTGLRAQIIRATCTNHCSARELLSKMKCDIFSKLRRVDDKTQTLKFEHVKVDKLEGFPCPVAGIELEEVNVNGSINGISFDDLQKNVLRTSGDQLITQEHIIADLRVDSVNAPNLEVASGRTRQTIRSVAIHARELNLTDGGLLLPLEGEPVTMTGTLTVDRAKFNGLIEQRGGLRGNSIKRFAPMVHFSEDRELSGNYTLSSVKVTGQLSAGDVARRGKGKGLAEIAEKAVRLDGDVPVHLALSRNRTLWTNITAENLPNWLTRKNSEMVKVTGKKIALQNVTLPESIYSKLPIPKLQAHACTVGAVTSNIRTSTLRVGQARAKVVVTENVHGAKELENVMIDAVTSLDEVDLSRKSFTGPVYVENLNISNFEDSPFYSFQRSKFKWYHPDVIDGLIKVKDLKVRALTTGKGIQIPSPTEIRNMIVEGNLQVKRINGIDLDDFVKNIVQINDTVSLKKVTFEGSLEVDEIQTTNVNIDLQNYEKDVHLGNKIISGDLEIEDDFWIPNLLSYPPEDEVNSYVVEGSIKFKTEPIVENINGKNLHELISEIWMLNRPSNLTGNFIFRNVTLNHPFDSYRLLHTPNFGSWASLESRLLSKTKLQEIEVPVYFKTATIPNIITNGNSTLHSSDQYLNDLLYMTLKKNENQTIKDKWHFDELIIEDSLTLLGKINNLNLSSDVVRHDIPINNIIGTKVVNELTVRHLGGFNFSDWAKDALMLSDTENLAIIKGRKTFYNLNVRNVNVSGKVMGKKLQDCLLKTGDQVIIAPKVIEGSLQAPSLTVDGLINGINLTDFLNNQLNNRESVQRIKSKVVFTGDLQIMGNLSVEGMFQGVELSKMNMINETIAPAMNTISYLKPFAIAIETVMKHQAKYWDKFEYVKENISSSTDALSPTLNNYLSFHKLGNCVLSSFSEVLCNKRNRYFLKIVANSTGILINQLLSVDDVPLVVQVSSGPRSRITVYMYDYITNSFDIAMSVRSPGITEASLASLEGVVWIATRLKSQMLLARFEPWGDLLKYHLPGSRLLALDRVPATNELVLVRDDGMWKLDGLAGPRHAFPVSLRADGIETFAAAGEFYVRLVCRNNGAKLLRARYVGF